MRIALVSSAGAAALLLAGAAQAQTAQAGDDAIPTVVVTDESKASTAYSFGSAVDSGTTVFSGESVLDRAPGSGDANQLLKLAPTVQFSANEGMADDESLQDLRPSRISIAGSSYLDNLFVLDGVGVNSRLDTFNTKAQHYGEVAGAASAQSIWVDSSLIGEIKLIDSNIPAEYGGFLGGVVDIKTRAPAYAYGATAYYGFTQTDMASYRMTNAVRAELEGVYPDKPGYEKSRYGFTIDLPVNDRLRLMGGYSYSDATVTYYRGSAYGGGPFGQTSKSENFLLKGEYDLATDLTLEGQITWSPYESMNASGNGIDNQMYQHGGGLASNLRLRGKHGAADWNVQLTYADSDNDRDAPAVNLSLPSSVANWCDSSNCTMGSFGDLEQSQQDYGLKTTWSQPLAGGKLIAGFDFTHTTAEKNRPQDNYAYSRSTVSSAVRCLYPEEAAALTCVPGSYALTQYSIYRAYQTQVDLQTYSLWGSYDFDWRGFEVRAGLRYGHETFLGNHDVSPRLSIAHDLPWFGMTATVGLNRYYSRGFLGYALREDAPDNYIYRRTPVRGVYGDWTLYSHTSTARYSDSDLKTPYSDELTAAVAGGLLGGEYRVKGILREGKDQFSLTKTTETYISETLGTRSRTVSTVDNDGSSSYRGLSVEWMRKFGRHTISFNSNVSHTKTSAMEYYDELEDTEAELVYYKGEVVSMWKALADNQRPDYASPIIINADLGSTWLNGRIRTNLNARFKDEFTQVEDTGENITVDGSAYDVYGEVQYDASIDANLSLQAEIARTQYGTTTLDLRVNNLFDTIRNNNSTSTSQPYQLGRNLWVSLKYKY
ncbi:TonB-dependent receptor plug domain-containing protein [Brevundimonas sp. EAKA]|uniref:TonB-dependent receptor plug domain-containing protein n=1 Tax=Brevundimonas sp. EAKA TaxID=1495854 RepID=UPI0005573B76|nr:TonB-dependent receptor plug domain-containing protein [Brevundimonas sp. EAKA]